jgi:xanthine/CO dehydrogenase XdhC/CoxF family maturation factor
MQEVAEQIARWKERGEKIALATVVRVVGSAPRREGAKMAITADGEMAGSVSGGCVEADVVLHAQEVLRSGQPKLVRYGISDEMAFEVGLACGGQIDVFIEPLEA